MSQQILGEIYSHMLSIPIQVEQNERNKVDGRQTQVLLFNV